MPVSEFVSLLEKVVIYCKKSFKKKSIGKMMKSFNITVDEKYFNLLWRSLSERESELEINIEQSDPDSDDAALMGNDLVYLRMCKKELEGNAKQANFSDGAFSLEDNYVDLSDL